METKFRVGDVVQHTFGSDREYRVRDVERDRSIFRIERGDWKWTGPSYGATLLRRPVQPGDRLRFSTPFAGAGVMTVTEVKSPGVWLGRATVPWVTSGAVEYQLLAEDIAAWEIAHEDGTPIDPPGAVSRILSCDTCGGVGASVQECDRGKFCSMECSARSMALTRPAALARTEAAKAVTEQPSTSPKPRTCAECGHSGPNVAVTINGVDYCGVACLYAAIDRAKGRAAAETFPAPVPTLPVSVEALASALFSTDPEVITFVESRADAVCRSTTHETRLEYEGRPSTSSFTIEWVESGRIKRALEIAWSRNENGWRERAEKRAARMIAVMKGEA